MINQFQEFLLRQGALASRYVPFHVKWVSDCYAFLDVMSATTLDAVTPPRPQRSEIHTMNEHDMTKFFEAAKTTPFYDFVNIRKRNLYNAVNLLLPLFFLYG